MDQAPFRLDRSQFKMQSFKEADNDYVHWQTKSLEERLLAAWYLISVAYNFDLNNPPRMDRSIFSMRKHYS